MYGKSLNESLSFKWSDENEIYGDSLDVYNIAEVSNKETAVGKNAFEVIDETCYELEKIGNIKDKIEWVVNNFEHTQSKLED